MVFATRQTRAHHYHLEIIRYIYTATGCMGKHTIHFALVVLIETRENAERQSVISEYISIY